MKNNKSPGTDGIPGESYKCFKEELTPTLAKVFNYALLEGDPPKSWAEAIISVIHKEGKDPTKCEGYRPISLLCNNQKILSAILTKRIQKVITKLIHLDQTGFILGRQGSNNIRRVLNIMSHAKTKQQSSMLLSLDAQKAFDRVDWVYLNHTLEKMGFHTKFIDWVKVLYLDPKSRVRVNGCCSQFFKIKRGVRQGDNLSPLLFDICLEPLAETIRQDKCIMGVKDGRGVEHKMLMMMSCCR